MGRYKEWFYCGHALKGATKTVEDGGANINCRNYVVKYVFILRRDALAVKFFDLPKSTEGPLFHIFVVKSFIWHQVVSKVY
jgi:hypothetical protein